MVVENIQCQITGEPTDCERFNEFCVEFSSKLKSHETDGKVYNINIVKSSAKKQLSATPIIDIAVICCDFSNEASMMKVEKKYAPEVRAYNSSVPLVLALIYNEKLMEEKRLKSLVTELQCDACLQLELNEKGMEIFLTAVVNLHVTRPVSHVRKTIEAPVIVRSPSRSPARSPGEPPKSNVDSLEDVKNALENLVHNSSVGEEQGSTLKDYDVVDQKGNKADEASTDSSFETIPEIESPTAPQKPPRSPEAIQKWDVEYGSLSSHTENPPTSMGENTQMKIRNHSEKFSNAHESSVERSLHLDANDSMYATDPTRKGSGNPSGNSNCAKTVIVDPAQESILNQDDTRAHKAHKTDKMPKECISSHVEATFVGCDHLSLQNVDQINLDIPLIDASQFDQEQEGMEMMVLTEEDPVPPPPPRKVLLLPNQNEVNDEQITSGEQGTKPRGAGYQDRFLAGQIDILDIEPGDVENESGTNEALLKKPVIVINAVKEEPKRCCCSLM